MYERDAADGGVAGVCATRPRKRPWPRGVCTFVPSPLRANRSRGGSVTGGWTELKDSALRIGHLDRRVIECGRYEYF